MKDSKDGMILSFLKLVVTIVVTIVVLTFALLKLLATIAVDATHQAADAGPSVKDALKVHGANAASRIPGLAAKADSDIRKAFKLHAHVAKTEDVA